MHHDAMTGYVLWSQVVLVLAVAATVIVLAAAAAAQWFRSAVWKRTIWQTAAVALCGLLLLELLGAGEAVIRLSRPASTPATSGPSVAAPSPAALPAAELPPLLAEPSGPSAPWSDLEGSWPPAVVEWARNRFDRFDRFEGPEIVEIPVNPAEEPPGPAWTPPDEPIAAEPASSVAVVATRVEQPPADPISPSSPGPVGTARWPGFVWAIGAAAILGRAAWTRLLLRRFRRRHGLADSEPLRRRVDGLARRLGIRRPVCLLEASGLRVPVAFGLARPTLVLPASFAGDFNDREQETILAHELAHLAARDPLWQLVVDALSAALWWHPLVWWLRGRLRAASEAAADEASLLVPGGPDVLAACLVALGRKIVNSRRLGWLSIEGPGFRSGLGRRVERLLSLQASACRAPAPVRLAIARIALPLALVVASVFSTAWARPQATPEQGETTMNLVKSSWQRSLAAMALAAWLGPASASPAADEKPPVKEAPPPIHAAPAQPFGPGHVVPKPAPNPAAIPRSPDFTLRPEMPGTMPLRPMDPKTVELLNKLRKLEAESRDLGQKLGELREDQDQEAKGLLERLRKVRREIHQATRELPPDVRARGMPPSGMVPPGAPAMGSSGGMMIGGPPPAGGRAPGGMGGGMGMGFGGGAGRGPSSGGYGGFSAGDGRGMSPSLPPEERQRRMQLLLEAAAENLRQAGLPEQAERLLREAEAVCSGQGPIRLRARERAVGLAPAPGAPNVPAPGGMSPPSAPPGMMSGPMNPMGAGPDPAAREIREQLRQIQRQVEELRRELQEMRERRSPRASARPAREPGSADTDPFGGEPAPNPATKEPAAERR